MVLQTSGQISLNDIHVELGSTSGSQVSINDTDVRALISSTAGTQVGFADFYGASNVTPIRNYVLTYFPSNYTNNPTHLGWATILSNSDGTELIFPTVHTQYNYRNYVMFGKLNVDTHITTTTATTNYGNQSTLYGYSHYNNFGYRYSSGGGSQFLVDHFHDESDSDYNFECVEFLNSGYDYCFYVARYLKSNGNLDWSRDWMGGIYGSHLANMTTLGAISSDNGAPIVLAQFTESSHPYYNNFLLFKFDPANSSTPLVWSANPQNVGVRVAGKPCRSPNNRISWGSRIADNSTYHDNIHVCQFQGLDWSSTYNNMTASWGRIIGTGNTLPTLERQGPAVCSDANNNIWVLFFDNVTFSGHSTARYRLNLVKFNSSGVPQEYYAMNTNSYYFTSASTYVDGFYHHPAIKGDYLWVNLTTEGINNISGAGNGYTETGSLLLKIKINNPSTSTDSNGTYITPDYQTIVGSDVSIRPYSAKIQGRINFAPFNVDDGTNGKVLFGMSMSDYTQVYYNSSKMFAIDFDINTNSTNVRNSRDLGFNSTGCQLKLYDLGVSALNTNVSNGVNNGDITSSLSNVYTYTAGAGRSSSGTNVFRGASSSLNPGMSYYWENT